MGEVEENNAARKTKQAVFDAQGWEKERSLKRE